MWTWCIQRVAREAKTALEGIVDNIIIWALCSVKTEQHFLLTYGNLKERRIENLCDYCTEITQGCNPVETETGDVAKPPCWTASVRKPLVRAEAVSTYKSKTLIIVRYEDLGRTFHLLNGIYSQTEKKVKVKSRLKAVNGVQI